MLQWDLLMGRRGLFGSGVLVLTLLFGCAATDGESDEEVGEDAQEVTTGRCAGTRATRTTTIKVMTINLRHDSDEWERRFKLIADEIVRLDPDLIGTQEVEIGKDQADKLNDLLVQRGHAKYNLYEKRKSGFIAFFGGEGIAIMSRWPITEKNHEDIGEQRVSIIARVKHPQGGFIDMVDTHLDQHGGAQGDADRDDEAKQTVDLIKRNDDCWPTFFTGDMNTTENETAITRFKTAGFVDSYRQVHGDQTPATGNTSPIVLKEGATQNPRRRIDFIFGRSAGGRTVTPLTSEVCFKNHDSKGFYPSDHLGIMTTYEVKL